MLHSLLIFLIAPAILCALNVTNDTLDTPLIEIFNLSLDSNTYLRPLRCQGFFVISQNLPVNISIQSQVATKVFISEKRYTSCDENIFEQCDKSSQICLQSEISGAASYSVNQCMPTFYVYLYLQKYQGGFISVEESDNAVCNTNVPPINPNIPSTACSNIPLDQCGVRGSTCNLGCYRVQCTYHELKSRREKTTAFCVNSTVSPSDWDNVCEQDYGFQNGKDRKAVGYYCNKSPVTVNMDSNSNQYGQSIIWQLIEWLFWLSVIAFIASVIYYRYMMNKTGNPPFTPPQWTPQFIYPRPAPQGDPLENYRNI